MAKPKPEPRPRPKRRPDQKPRRKPGNRPGKAAEKALKADIIETAKEAKAEPTLSMDGLEKAAESLTDDSRHILEFLITDAMNDDADADQNVTRAVKRACRRAQMKDGSSNEMSFFRHVQDPGFMKIVKDTGAALVGAHILPLVATLLNIAIEERKQWAMTACLKISGLLPTQYDIYQLKYENTHVQNFSGEVNYASRSDKELEDIWSSIHDESEAEEASVEDRTG